MKWLRQVCDYRPIVERILGLGDAKNCQFGERCKRGIQEARHQWTRAIVVKLFIEHICTENHAESEIKRCQPLWVVLGNETDLKRKESLDIIEKFLKICNRKVITSYFEKVVNCSSCENLVEGAPVRLPCQHDVCRNCFENFITLSELECTHCHVPFPADFNPGVEPGQGRNITKYQDYRRRCNTFFMEIVSQLCFAEGTPPSHDVIQKLLSYITGERRGRGGARIVFRDLTIFDDSFDPTPVVRSFLLQQLMQTSGEEVDRYLETYFNHTSKLLGTDNQKQLVELCLLVLQCLEDSHHQQNSRRSHVSDSLQYTDSTSTEDETIIVKDLLTAASQQIFTDIGTLECIKYIASVRFALSVVAKYIHHMYGSTQKTIKLNSNIRRMFAAAAQLCEDCGSPWPKNYFIKQLCRCYSIDSYYSVLTKKDVSFLSWVQLPQINVEQVNDCFDRYIICGQEYLHIRETVLQTLMHEEGTQITDMLQKIPIESEWKTRVNLMLAIHRLITMSYVKEEEHQTVSAEDKVYLIHLITRNWTRPNDKALATDILHNTVWKSDWDRNIYVDMDLAQQNIACLLTHFLILMSEIPGKSTLVTPLQLLSLQPHRMRHSFFPTMPNDEVANVREALLAARQAHPNENPVFYFYRCPNGHPYVIGDCEWPQVEHKCNVCGKQIGGTKHILRPDHENVQRKGRIETGHILGRATTLGPVVAPERKLNRASFAILRLLTHVSMYVGANVSAEAVIDSIRPDIEQEDLASYLMEHIELDLTMIQSAVGKNKDDVLVLIHYILSHVMEVHTTAVIEEDVPEDLCKLTSRDGRDKWEKLFVKKYITPVLQDIENVVTTWNDRIINDRKLESDHLLQIVYEINAVKAETESLDNLWDIPAVWRYKTRISVDHLMQTLNISKQKCPVLRLFLKEEYHLRVIRFAPSILRLQKLLIQKYNKKLDRTEANLMKVENVKENMHQDGKFEEFESLLADFIEAWDCVRESLETYVCPANQTVISVSRECCKTRITDSTPVSYLLPTYKDTGLCSFVLLYFLMDKQNIFLKNYCHRCNISEDNLPKVHVKDISSAHLISYHPDRDLLPMVYANCNYPFEVGQGTKVDYNVTNLERQLMDRFLFSKSFISHIQEIETFTHRAESTNALVFKALSQRIKQERLHQSVQSQIHRELQAKAYPDLCESLDKLDIAISFLKSVGSDPDSSLYDFMTNTLKMDSAFPSPKAQQVSKCKHTMSWWVTLALERAKRLTKHKQEVFEGLSENLKEDLNEEQKKVTEEIVNSLPLEHIDILVTLVFECIVLKIDIPQNKDEDDYVDMSNISLHDTLTAYISASPYDEDKLVDQILITAIGKLPTDPQDQNRIMTGQSVSFWKFINRLLVSKQQQRL